MSIETKLREKLMQDISSMSKADLVGFVDRLLENLLKEESFAERLLDSVDVSITKRIQTAPKLRKATKPKPKPKKKIRDIRDVSDDDIAKAIAEELKNVPEETLETAKPKSKPEPDPEPEDELQPIDIEEYEQAEIDKQEIETMVGDTDADEQSNDKQVV